MRLNKIICVISVCLLPSIVFSQETKKENTSFYAVSELGTTTYQSANQDFELTGNSWNLGLGYEFNSGFSAELFFGSAFRLKETYPSGSYDFNFTTASLYLNYKIINSGNYRPFIGIGSVSGTRTIQVNGATTFSESGNRFVYDIGVEIPLDDNSSIRFKYASSTKQTDENNFSSANAGLLFRF
jgi:outer membrane protein W